MTNDKVKIINVYETIGGSAAVSQDDGQILYDKISTLIHKEFKVCVDFNNITLIISTFLNSAIGQLYNEFSIDEIKQYLEVKNMDSENMSLLKKVVDRAKEYFDNPQMIDDSIKKVIDDE